MDARTSETTSNPAGFVSVEESKGDEESKDAEYVQVHDNSSQVTHINSPSRTCVLIYSAVTLYYVTSLIIMETWCAVHGCDSLKTVEGFITIRLFVTGFACFCLSICSAFGIAHCLDVTGICKDVETPCCLKYSLLCLTLLGSCFMVLALYVMALFIVSQLIGDIPSLLIKILVYIDMGHLALFALFMFLLCFNAVMTDNRRDGYMVAI